MIFEENASSIHKVYDDKEQKEFYKVLDQHQQQQEEEEQKGPPAPPANVNFSFMDIFQIHDVSLEVLEFIYNNEFKKSEDFQVLYAQMQDNMIEYRFFTMAGMGGSSS